MNTVSAMLNHPVMRQVGWALLHSLWQGALSGVVFAGLRYALRRRSARVRYAAGCLCLLALVVAPVLTLVLGGRVAGALPSDLSDLSDRSDVAAVLRAPVGVAGGFSGSSPIWPAGGGADFFTQLAPWLAMTWVLGVLIFSARLTRSCCWVRDLRTRDCEDVGPAWLSLLDDLRHRLRVSRPVRLLKSALVEVPTVVGWLRPVILLPAATLSGLTPSQLEAILAHELAHVRRLDYLVNTFQCLVETLMFYHPVAWWISRCIREERENCCDDVVVELCGDRVGYARALATLEGLRAELPGWAFAASGGSLLGRIRRLLDVGNESGAIRIREVSGLALLSVGLLMILLGIRMLLATPSNQSTARIRVERDQSDISGLGEPRGGAFYDPYFIQTEFEVIQSEVVLGKVIEQLDLNKQWGIRYAAGEKLKTAESMEMLRGRLDLRPVRNTSIIQIRVYDEKPDEAAKIANAIAEAYRDHRQQRRTEMSKGGIRALEERYAEQEAKIRDAQKREDDLRKVLNVLNIPAAGAVSLANNDEAPAPIITADELRKLESLFVENKAEYVRETSLLTTLNRLKAEHGYDSLTQTLPTVMTDTVLSSFLERLGIAEGQLASLTKDYGPQHIEVVKVKSQIEDLRAKVRQRVDGIMLGLQAKASSLSNSLDNLEKEVGTAAQADSENAKALRAYLEAKRNLEELQRFRQVLEMKIASEKIDYALPKTAMVEIVDRAVPATRPTSPNVPRAVAMIFLGLLMDIAGLLLLTGRPNAVREPPSAPKPA